MLKDPSERFWRSVAKGSPDVCWQWLGATRAFGYGSFYNDGRLHGAHRFSWFLTHGAIPDGLYVLHRCDAPACVNPSHLFLGTHADNMADKAKKGRDTNKNKPFCKHGHPRTPENIYMTSEGLKQCRECHRLRQSKYNAKRVFSRRRIRRNIEIRGDQRSLTEWCKSLGVSMKTASARIAAGWPVEEALLTPPLPTGKRRSGRVDPC